MISHLFHRIKKSREAGNNFSTYRIISDGFISFLIDSGVRLTQGDPLLAKELLQIAGNVFKCQALHSSPSLALKLFKANESLNAVSLFNFEVIVEKFDRSSEEFLSHSIECQAIYDL